MSMLAKRRRLTSWRPLGHPADVDAVNLLHGASGKLVSLDYFTGHSMDERRRQEQQARRYKMGRGLAAQRDDAVSFDAGQQVASTAAVLNGWNGGKTVCLLAT